MAVLSTRAAVVEPEPRAVPFLRRSALLCPSSSARKGGPMAPPPTCTGFARLTGGLEEIVRKAASFGTHEGGGIAPYIGEKRRQQAIRTYLQVFKSDSPTGIIPVLPWPLAACPMRRSRRLADLYL
jgi:hypothetical protein